MYVPKVQLLAVQLGFDAKRGTIVLADKSLDRLTTI